MIKIIFARALVAAITISGVSTVYAQIAHPTYGNCKVLFPKESTSEGAFCNAGFIVSYFDQALSSQCFSTKEKAAAKCSHQKFARWLSPSLSVTVRSSKLCMGPLHRG